MTSFVFDNHLNNLNIFISDSTSRLLVGSSAIIISVFLKSDANNATFCFCDPESVEIGITS